MSNGMLFRAITTGVPQVTPPSKERLKVMLFAAMSFQATYTSPPGPVVTVAPMARPGPFWSSIRTVANVRPWSRERASRTPPDAEPPLAASHAT